MRCSASGLRAAPWRWTDGPRTRRCRRWYGARSGSAPKRRALRDGIARWLECDENVVGPEFQRVIAAETRVLALYATPVRRHRPFGPVVMRDRATNHRSGIRHRTGSLFSRTLLANAQTEGSSVRRSGGVPLARVPIGCQRDERGCLQCRQQIAVGVNRCGGKSPISMQYRWSIAVAIVCLAAVDLPHGSSLSPPPPNATQPFPSGENIPVLPMIVVDDRRRRISRRLLPRRRAGR